MSSATLTLLVILILGIWGKSDVIVAAAAILILLQVVGVQRLFYILEGKGLEIGLTFLMLSVLVPFATGKVGSGEMLSTFISVPGLIMIISGMIATHLNGHGLTMLQQQPSLIVGLVIGSIIGVIFFGGIPVGPLMAGGIAALFLNIIQLFR